MMTRVERETLRGLAIRVREIAALPGQETRRNAWRDCNRLRPGRPRVVCFPEGAWLECIPDHSLRCADPLLRDWETRLRMVIYMHEAIGDDQPIDAVFNVGWDLRQTGVADRLQDGGLRRASGAPPRDEYFVHPYLELKGQRCLDAVKYDPPMQDRSDLERLVMPEFSVCRHTSDQRLELAREMFGDILDVRRRGNSWAISGGPGNAVGLRGMETLMLDMYDDPPWVHAFIQFLCRAHTARLDFLEQGGYLSLNNGCEWVGTGGIGYSDELPAPGFDPEKVRCQDIWGGIQLQELVGLSPSMFAEFFLPYIVPIMKRYGLGTYGCCEPVHDWLPGLMQIPNLRRISISPWSDIRKCAEHMRGAYVFSYKPSPAVLSTSRMDEVAISAGLESAFAIMRDNGCVVEVLMKDLHTVQGQPARISRWVALARRAIDRIYG